MIDHLFSYRPWLYITNTWAVSQEERYRFVKTNKKKSKWIENKTEKPIIILGLGYVWTERNFEENQNEFKLKESIEWLVDV